MKATGGTICKVGEMSGLTTTVITDVNEDDILVSHMFYAEGDSGSIVFTEVDGIYFIVGIIAGNDNKAKKIMMTTRSVMTWKIFMTNYMIRLTQGCPIQ